MYPISRLAPQQPSIIIKLIKETLQFPHPLKGKGTHSFTHSLTPTQ